MTTTNGSHPDFTHTLLPFDFEGHTFRRRKIPARVWAETLQEVAVREKQEIEKEDGSVLFAVSGDGLQQLIRLGVHEDDLPVWDKLWKDGRMEFGELAALRDWLWEQMTARPFTSGTRSSDGPGSTSDPSSKDESPSPVEVARG